MTVFIERALFNELLPPGAPVITNPYFPSSSTPLQLSVTGVNSHFDQATTQLLVPGLIIISTAVVSPTNIYATATRDTGIPPGPTSVSAITGTEVAVAPNSLLLP